MCMGSCWYIVGSRSLTLRNMLNMQGGRPTLSMLILDPSLSQEAQRITRIDQTTALQLPITNPFRALIGMPFIQHTQCGFSQQLPKLQLFSFLHGGEVRNSIESIGQFYQFLLRHEEGMSRATHGVRGHHGCPDAARANFGAIGESHVWDCLQSVPHFCRNEDHQPFQAQGV